MKRYIILEIETDESSEKCGKNCPHYVDDKVIRKCKMPWREQFLVPTGICDYAFRDPACLAAEIAVDDDARLIAELMKEGQRVNEREEKTIARAYLAITEKMK